MGYWANLATGRVLTRWFGSGGRSSARSKGHPSGPHLRKWLVLAGAASMFLASACMIGPDFKRPPAPIGNKWLEAGDRSGDTSQNARTDYKDWWTLFNDPILTKLIQIAYRQNLTLLTAGLRVLEARAQLGIAIGEFYPQQQLMTGSVSYQRIPLSNFNLISNTFWNNQLGAQSSWELDLWGKFRRG